MRPVIVAPFVSVIDDRSAQLGGAQAIVADLACGLAAAGHDVTLLAASGSHVEGVRVVDLGVDASRMVPATLHAATARRDDQAQRDAFGRARAWIDRSAHVVDVVHAHAYDAPAFELLVGIAPSLVHTLHLPPTDPTVVAAAKASTATHVTVSRANADAWTAAGVRIDAVIPNGVDVRAVPLGRGEGGYLLVAGRISPEKGVDVAVRVARDAGMPLWIAGDRYGDHSVELEGARLLGPRPRSEVFRLMGAARALLMPVAWDEPFGLVAVEAMAAGTPVVAYRRGGLAEVVEDGRTGFLVAPGDERAFAAAIRRVASIDRAACRERAERLFSLERMVAAHAALYGRL